MKTCITRIVLAFVTVTLLSATTALAQATRTWVSSVGDDASPCTRTASCRTFAGAASKTAAKGEINVLDAGDFGAVTITKALTITGIGRNAVVMTSSGNGITINAGASDVVRLLHLHLNGQTTSASGVQFNTGAALIVDDLFVEGFATGIETYTGMTTIDHSLVVQNSEVGVHARGGTVFVRSTLLAANAVAAQAGGSATLRLQTSGLYNNGVALGCGGGTLATNGENHKAGNSNPAVPGCSPSATFTKF